MNNQTKVLEKLIESNLKLTSTVSETLDLLRLKLETELEIEKLRLQNQGKSIEILYASGALDTIMNIVTDKLKGNKNESDSTTK